MSYNPFDKFGRGFKMNQASVTKPSDGGNDDFARAVPLTKEGEVKRSEKLDAKKVEVQFPRHLYIPEGAESIDLRRVVNLPTAYVDYELFSFTAPQGALVKFISYGVYNDGDNGANYDFRPLVDGSRVFRYHGDPTLNFKIYLGLGPDLSNTSMLPCQLTLQPGQTIKWLITNTSGVDTSMGVRMIGYLDTSNQRVQGRFGG